MDTSAITSSLLSQISGSTSTSNEFVSDLNSLATDLTAGNLSAAQEDYVTLSQDALNGGTSSTSNTLASGITANLLADIASSSSSSSAFVGNLSQLGNDLQSGDLASSQQDMLGLDSTALNAASSVASSSGTTTAAAVTSANPAEAGMLIQSIVEAMAAGDSSAVSTGLSQLASVSSSADGASYLQSLSGSVGSSSGSSSSSSLSQLIASANYSSSSDTSSLLNVLA
jgi:hypothetical protein